MKMFISYRRDDSAGYAGRLFDYLSAHFGAANVFMDIDTIQPGEDFRKVVSMAVGSCDVVLVMIGKQWAGIVDAQGQRRLEDPRDWVRMEISAALANRRVRVIPVLVRDAAMPGEHELPEGLKELAWRNAIELSDSRFQHDVRKLIGVIERIAPKTPAQPAAPVRKPGTNNLAKVLLLAGIPVLFVLGLLVWMVRSVYMAPDATAVVGGVSTATAGFVASTATLQPPTEPATQPAATLVIETATPEPSATPTEVEVSAQLVQLIDDYFGCVNAATHDRREDHVKCWDMLSDRPGEFQDSLTQNSGGIDAFISYWNKYRVSYSLYYCFEDGRHFVHAEYYHHKWDDLSQIVAGRNLIDYRFALDPQGWRITGGFVPTQRSPYCESQPRIDKLSLFQ